MPKVLFSAFEPFEEAEQNSSELILNEFVRSRAIAIEHIILPVSFKKAWPALRERLEMLKPDFVVALGQAETRNAIGVEQVALNIRHARIADNDGEQPLHCPVSVEGPLALESTLPHQSLCRKLIESGIKAELSFHAGTFVCNSLMYSLLEWSLNRPVKAGFVHIPLLRGQTSKNFRENDNSTPSLTLTQGAKAVEIIYRFLTKEGEL